MSVRSMAVFQLKCLCFELSTLHAPESILGPSDIGDMRGASPKLNHHSNHGFDLDDRQQQFGFGVEDRRKQFKLRISKHCS